jgi:hypothetical protein
MCIICSSREEELSQLTALDCSGCVTLKVIPLIPSLQILSCYHCPLLVTIPLIPSLLRLECYHCPLLVNIPLLPSLQTLGCSNCPLLVNIPLLPSLQYLYCYNCPLLLNIPVASYYTNKSGCRWLNDLTLVTRVIICQKYIKATHKGRLLTRALKNKCFVEWIYSPGVGGKYIKRRLLDEI